MRNARIPAAIRLLGAVAVLTAAINTPAADTNSWTYVSGNNDWTNTANWSQGHAPLAGEIVIIDGTNVDLTSDTADLGGLVLTNGGSLSLYASPTNGGGDHGLLLSVSGGVSIAGSSWIHSYSDTTNGGSPLIRCENLTAAASGGINANSRGFRGGSKYIDPANPYEHGFGPGYTRYSNHGSSGAGYGGAGGRTMNAPGVTYGDPTAPIHPGSGAGGTRYGSHDGGDGGGLIRIEASGAVTVDGTFSADGQDTIAIPGDGGGGSGGGVYVQCDTFQGSGLVTATGGDGRGHWHTQYEERSGGGGGGGRVAIVYDTVAQAALGTQPTVTFDIGGGVSTPFNHLFYRLSRGRPGTLYLPDDVFFDIANVRGARLIVPGFTAFATNSWTISDGSLAFPTGFTLTVSQDLTISGRGGIELADSACTVGGDLSIASTGPGHAYFYGGLSASVSIGTNLSITGGWMEFDFTDAASNALVVPGDLGIDNGGLYVTGDPDDPTTVQVGGDWSYTNSDTSWNALSVELHSGMTNGGGDYGMLVDIGGDMNVEDACWVYLYSHYTNGGSPKVLVRNLDVAAGGAFTGDGGGFSGGIYALGGYNAPGYGPGGSAGGTYGSGGAGYGGEGGQSPGGATGGATYGDSNAPVHPGSGGGGGQTSNGGRGGGIVRLEAAHTVTINGTLSANGAEGVGGYTSPGSGGSVSLTCNYLVGSASGLLRANGAKGKTSNADNNRGSGGGGGGRILVVYNRDTNGWQGAAQANGGAKGGYATDPDVEPGDPGTIVFKPGPIPPIITNQYATGVTLTNADLNGYVTSTGTSATTVWVLWGESDGGTNLGTWANTNIFPGFASVAPIGTNVSVSGSTAYFYRYYAINAGGPFWADPVAYLFTAPVWVTVPDPNADEDGLDPAQFSVHRPAWATNEPTTVFYSLSGTASNGVDYELLSGGVVIPAGASNAPVAVTPLADGDPAEGTEEIVLTVTPGAYLVGSMNVATSFLADAPVDPTNSCINTGLWSDAAIWSSGHKPVSGQYVIVTNDITLSEATANMGAVRVANATITMANWSTRIEATEVVLQSGTVLTLPAPFEDTDMSNRVALAGSNITIDAGALINVDALGFKAENGPGAGGYDGHPSWYGGGGAYGGRGGDGHPAANEPGGTTYGAVSAPIAPGSGGGGYGGGRPDGGQGGGAVSIEATGRVTVNGTISANGGNGTGGSKGSAGSGGGVYVSCREFAGATGVIRANGGVSSTYGGAGGGRIAVNYNVAAQAAQNLAQEPTVAFLAKRGTGNNLGRPGTLYFTDSSFYPGATVRGGQVVIPGTSALARDSLASVDGLAVFTNLTLTVANTLSVSGSGALEITNGVLSAGNLDCNGGKTYVYGGLAFGDTDLTVGGLLELTLSNAAVNVPGTFTLSSGGDVRILRDSGVSPDLTVGGDLVANGGSLSHYGSLSNASAITVAGDLVLTNSGAMYVYSGLTNAIGTNYGFAVRVTGDTEIASGAWLYPESHYLDGGAPLFRTHNLLIANGGGIDANGLGFSGGLYALGGYNSHGYGPGGTAGYTYGGGGAGYGGRGGNGPAGATTAGGPTYGSSNAPVQPGSGGGGGQTGNGFRGGGGVRIEVLDTATVDGTVTANGASAGGYHSPGSGGAVYITCDHVAGAATGLLRVNGGNGSNQYSPGRGSGGGGGGRIAVVYVYTATGWQGSAEAVGGAKGEDDPDTEPGETGTVVFLYNPPPQGSMFVIH